MDFNYDNQNHPSDQQQLPHHSQHSSMSNSLQQHLQLQPASQQQGSFLQSHHHQPHLNHGDPSLPFLSRWGSPGFGTIPGEGRLEGVSERSLLQQDVLSRSASQLPQVRDGGQVLHNLLGSAVEEGNSTGATVNPPGDHLEPSTITPMPPTRFSQPTEPNTRPAQSSSINAPFQTPVRSTAQQSPSNSITTPLQPQVSSSRPIITPTKPPRLPLAEKQPQIGGHDNLQRNISQRVGQVGNSKKSIVHAKLPEGFDYRFADETDRIIGVVVNRVIHKGQWFGPFDGSLLGEEDGLEIGSTWEICLRGKVKFYIDARSKFHNNWLYHINPARTTQEQNLEAFQHYGDIYFRSLDIIQPGTELKVFYSDEYREKIGCKMKLDELRYDKEADCFKCPWCDETYQTSKIILRHIKVTHTNRDQTSDMINDLVDSPHKKGRHMEAEKQPSRENSSCRPLERGSSNKPKKPSKEEGCFVCVTCGSRFPTNGRLIAHERFHESTIERFECNMCDAVYKTSLSLMRHKKSHESLHYRCSLCSKIYTTRSHLSRHMNTAHGFMRSKGQIICTGCSRSFCLEYNMMEHLRSCKGLQMQIKNIQVFMTVKDESFIPYEKFGCDASQEAPCEDPRDKTVPPLPRPVESQTTNATNKCSICHKVYNTRSHLSRHMHTKHGFGRSNGNIVCMGCSKTFLLEENMSQHFEQCTGSQGFMMREEKRRSREFGEDFVFIPNEEEGRSDLSKTMEDPVQAEVHAMNNDLMKTNFGEHNDGFLPQKQTQMQAEQACNQPGDNDLNKKQALIDCTQKQGKRRIVDMLGVRMGQNVSLIPFKCCYCKKRFFTKSRLNRHKWEKHPNCSVFKCDQCDRTFPNRYRRNKHQNSHVKEKHYKCQQCPRSFASEKALSNHQKEHTEARPHKCETCMKGFKTKYSLQEHNVRLHSDRELRFACSICNKKFAEKHYLAMHERRHIGLRPHVCVTCGKAFTTKFSLTNHDRVHTGEKPFKCHVCEKTFSLNHHLQDHLFSFHKQSEDTTARVQGSTPT